MELTIKTRKQFVFVDAYIVAIDVNCYLNIVPIFFTNAKSGRLGYIAEYQDGGSGTSFGFLSVCEKIYKSGLQPLNPGLTKIWVKMSSMYSHVDRA